MKRKHVFLILVAAVGLPPACSAQAPKAAGSGGDSAVAGSGGASGAAGALGDNRLFVPEGLPNTPREGEEGATLKLVAFTLQQGSTGLEFYAAVKNDGNMPACNPGIMIDFMDKAGATVAMVGSALLGNRLYLYTDQAGDAILNCIDPDKTGMSASRNLSAQVAIEDIGELRHDFPAWGGLDGIVPLDALTADNVETFARGTEGAYTGTVNNGLNRAVSRANVTIFPVNRAGRPLGAATSIDQSDLPAGGSWSFETSTVSDGGAGHAVYVGASVSSP